MSMSTRSQKRKEEYEEGTVVDRIKKRGKRSLKGVMTWNLQGAGGNDQKAQIIRGWMDNDDVQVICLQECSDLYNWAAVGNANLPGQWTVAFYEVWDAGGNNNRCSLGILTRGEANSAHSFAAIAQTQRPLAGVKVMGNFWVWTVHAPANPNGQGNQAYIQACLLAAKQWSGGSWMCAGDFNCDLLQNNPVTGYTVVNTGLATRAAKEYDYAYVGGNWLGTWVATLVDTGNVSDHKAVRFDLEEE